MADEIKREKIGFIDDLVKRERSLAVAIGPVEEFAHFGDDAIRSIIAMMTKSYQS
jgi:hypothetical protein